MDETTTEQTPGQRRTAKARARAARVAQEKRAEYLRARGWTVIPPDATKNGDDRG